MGKTLQVFFVGESAKFVDKIVQTLESGKFRVTWQRVQTFSNIHKFVDDHSLDFVFLNYDLIEKNQLTFLRSIHCHLKEVPIVLISNHVIQDISVDAFGYGVIDFITRSDLKRLLPIIHREFNHRKTQQQQKLVLKDLQLRERFLLDVFNSVQEGICVIDNDFNIIRVNRWMSDQFKNGQPLHGEKCYQILKNQSKPCANCPSRITLRTGQPQKTEYTISEKSNSVKQIAVNAYPFKNSHQQIIGLILGVKDITPQREAEKQLRELNRQLEKRVRNRTAQLEAMNKELEAFTSSVSHDLRAPLIRIDGFSQLLIDEHLENLNSEARHYLNRIRHSIQNMFGLIDDFLSLSRFNLSKLDVKEVDLSKIAKLISHHLKQTDPKREAEFEIQNGLKAYGDHRLINYVLRNLFENAWKFTKKNRLTRIEFGLRNHIAEPAFYVRDNGVGFNQTSSQEIFAPFKRLHKNSDFPGNGIGLTTVKRIIHRHGGNVWAESNEKIGATFYFSLPV